MRWLFGLTLKDLDAMPIWERRVLYEEACDYLSGDSEGSEDALPLHPEIGYV